jgi:hypothetical protein
MSGFLTITTVLVAVLIGYLVGLLRHKSTERAAIEKSKEEIMDLVEEVAKNKT